MKRTLTTLLILLIFSLPVLSETKNPEYPTITVYRSESCGCCKGWIEHMKENGFKVKDKVSTQMTAVKKSLKIPLDQRSCHTGLVGGYTVEGHVPADVIKKLLLEKPKVNGISAPGMPIGSPGMEFGDRKDPYSVMSHDANGNTQVYSKVNQ